MGNPTHSRRGVLGLVGGVVGTTALGDAGLTLSDTTSAAAEDGAPAVQWRQSYEGQEREYRLNRLADVFQTEDGGYALPGDGAPVHETGAEDEQFLLVKTNAEGDQQWIAFANTERDTEEHTTTDGVRTSDGGYGLVGNETYRYTEGYSDRGEEYERDTTVAAAAKIDRDGQAVWTATLDALEDNETEDESAAGGEDQMYFTSAAPDTAGGFVAGGTREGTTVLVKFDADGAIAWERRYDGYMMADRIFVRESGYLLVATNADGDPYALFVTEEGELQQEVPLNVDRDETPHNHVFVPTTDGGYAYTGRDKDRENMVLGKLNEEGKRQWREEYDGPYEGLDSASDVVQTADGGYALGGSMSAAYSGDPAPTILKTDESGTEEWRTLLDEESHLTNFYSLIQTADGGYVGKDATTIVKFGPAEASSPTETTTDTPTGTETGTDSATETATPSDPDADSEPETGTDTETESETTTDATPTEADTSDGDCPT